LERNNKKIDQPNTYFFFVLKDLETQIQHLEREILLQESKVKAMEMSSSDKNKKLRWILGGIGMLSLPLVFYTSGKDLAYLLYLRSMRELETKAEDILKDVEKTENGSLNPHWTIAKNALVSWKSASRKLRWRSTVSLASKVRSQERRLSMRKLTWSKIGNHRDWGSCFMCWSFRRVERIDVHGRCNGCEWTECLVAGKSTLPGL
jgi:hypothetical protein